MENQQGPPVYPYHESRAMRRSPTPRPWRPDFRGTTGVSLSSPSYLVRNPNQALHLEKTHETPPSSRDVGLLFLHGLEPKAVKLANPPERVLFKIPPALPDSETRPQPANTNVQKIASRFLSSSFVTVFSLCYANLDQLLKLINCLQNFPLTGSSNRIK